MLRQSLAEVTRAARLKASAAAEDSVRDKLGMRPRGQHEPDYQTEIRAHRAGLVLSSLFAASSIAWIARSRDAEERQPLKDITGPVIRRVETTIATEITDAQSQSQLRAVSNSGFGLAVVWVWNAVLDKFVCAECASMDGKQSVLGHFAIGFPPVHPNCRCFVEVA